MTGLVCRCEFKMTATVKFIHTISNIKGKLYFPMYVFVLEWLSFSQLLPTEQ